MTLTETYQLYTYAIEIQETYFNFIKKGDLKFNCSVCGRLLSGKGANSHSRLHPQVNDDKIKFLKTFFNGFDASVYSGEKICYDNKLCRRSYIVTINSHEYKKINQYVFRYERYYNICPNCGEEYFKNCKSSYCKDLRQKLKCTKLKAKHAQKKNTPEYFEWIEKLKVKAVGNGKHFGARPWNAGLRGY